MERIAKTRTGRNRACDNDTAERHARVALEGNGMKILHVVVDDKFIDWAIREFEAVEPGVHEYIIIDGTPPFRYVKYSGVRSCPKSTFSREVCRENVKAVVFHFMVLSHYNFLDVIPKSKKVFWLGWGSDYYDTLLSDLYPKGLCLPLTLALCRRSIKERAVGIARDRLRRMRQVLRISLRHNPSRLERVDYFSPVLDLEFHLVRKLNPWFRADYVTWNYGTVEDDLSLPGPVPQTLGHNLLVGNSATPTNNHAEAFRIVADRVDLSGRKVIVPLSYGDDDYRDRVIELGQKLLGPAFVPLTAFLPYDEYIRILTSCGVVMMNHLRQQALGNICISGLLGAKLLLNRHSPLFDWLIEKGIGVNDIETADLTPLTQEQRNANANAIRAHWGRDAQRSKTRRFLNLALA